jgi:hypothetical protein
VVAAQKRARSASRRLCTGRGGRYGRGAVKGATFVLGWLVSLAIVVAITVLATGNNPPKPNTASSLGALAAKIAIGGFLVAIAIRQRRRMGQPKKPPKWQEHVDTMSPWFAMSLAPAVQPWALIGADAATVTQAKLSLPRTVRILHPSLDVLPRHGDLRRCQARPEQGVPGLVGDDESVGLVLEREGVAVRRQCAYPSCDVPVDVGRREVIFPAGRSPNRSLVTYLLAYCWP